MPKHPRINPITYAPPPAALPMYQRADPRDVSFFGRTNYVASFEEKRFIFGIRREDRLHHMYIVGKGGVGKSKLIELLIRQDIAYGYGAFVFDPTGDLMRDALDFMPKSRIADVVLVDASDRDWLAAFNPLEGVHAEYRHRVAEGLVGALRKSFGAEWNARMEHIYRFACLALLEAPATTMLNFIPFLTDAEFRAKMLPHISDASVKKFWESEFSQWAERYADDAIMPLVNKLSQYFSDPVMGRILAQRENRIDLSRIIAENKIVFVHLSRHLLGDDGAGFLGALFLVRLNEAVMRRAHQGDPKKEKTFYIYIDEFSPLATPSLAALVTEGRTANVALALSHQFMAQVPPDIMLTVMGSAGTLVIFRVNGDDAGILDREMAPVFRGRDMINLGSREFYIKMMIEGEPSDPFSAETLNVLPPQHSTHREDIITHSRKEYTGQ